MKYKINLFPPPKLSLVDKAVFFSYNYLRYILVLTQLVVLGVFTYRFTVDQEIVDMKEDLKNKQVIVKLSSPLLQQASVLDERIKNIQTVINKQDSFSEMLNYYLSVFPQKVNATKLTLKQNEVYLEGTTTDVVTLKSFYNKVKNEGKFKQTELKNVQRIDNGYSFILSLREFNS